MKNLHQLIDKIIRKININLTEYDTDISPFVKIAIETKKLTNLYASYETDSTQPLNLTIKGSNIAGSYFIGNCSVKNSVVYKSDVRGDELKREGDLFALENDFRLPDDEIITIKNSFLLKVLIHSTSNNPETPEEFFIRNTVAADYSIINGSTIEGSFLGSFSTADHTTLQSCMIGNFSYIKGDEFYHQKISDGTIMIQDDAFSFKYTYPQNDLKKYITTDKDHRPAGLLIDFNDNVTPLTESPPTEMYGKQVSSRWPSPRRNRKRFSGRYDGPVLPVPVSASHGPL